jgi:TPR repeat protein
MPEKLHYGYVGVERNFDEPLRLYRQAAELG